MGKSMIQSPQPKKRVIPYTNDNVLETIRSIGSSVGKTVTHDVAGQIGSDILRQLTFSPPKTGELKPNETIDFTERRAEMPQPIRPAEHLRPVVRSEDVAIKQQIEAVRRELVALAQSVKRLHQEIHNAVMDVPVAPGVYHLNFFEQLKTFLVALRSTIDDSSTWLSAFHARGKKKMGFWGLYKKHGTQFGLSNERTLATQAG